MNNNKLWCYSYINNYITILPPRSRDIRHKDTQHKLVDPHTYERTPSHCNTVPLACPHLERIDDVGAFMI